MIVKRATIYLNRKMSAALFSIVRLRSVERNGLIESDRIHCGTSMKFASEACASASLKR
jgi:hypothetical protein